VTRTLSSRARPPKRVARRWARLPKRVARRWAAALLCAAGITAWAADPLAAQTLSFTPIGSIPGPANLIEIDGARAYVVGGDTLTIVDISNPVAPKRLGAYTFPQKIWGIRVVHPLVYVAADFFGLGILDVSNPAAPALRGSLKTPGQAKNVAVFGTRAAVADHMSGVNFIDTSDAAKPVMIGSFYLDGYARDVAASGSVAYAVDAPTGLYVFDLAKPDPVEPVSTQQSAKAPGSLVVSEASGTPGPKVAVLVGGGALQVYDLSQPAAPVRVGNFPTSGRGAARAALIGSRVYVADSGVGLQVVDVSTPKAPRLLGTYKTPTPARDVAVAGPLVFIVVGAAAEAPREFKDQEVLILRQTP
jgi:hypothetical protein